jgi:hypothetical protein
MVRTNAAIDSVKITQAPHASVLVSVTICPDLLDVAEEAGWRKA